MDVYAPTFTQTSARATKTDVSPVDPGSVLAGVEDLEVATWEFVHDDDGTRHMGPMAEDFHDAFGLGTDERHIATVDATGVAMAAIQALSRELDDARETIDARDDRIAAQQAQIDALKTENEAARDRLAAVETHLGLDDTATAAGDD